MLQSATFSDLAAAADGYRRWLVDDALPLWADAGVDPVRGSFIEKLTAGGEPIASPRRARVQARQVWSFASAARAGHPGPWLGIAEAGFDFYSRHYRRSDSLFAMLADEDGRVLDDTAYVYEQAFSLLSMSALYAAAPAHGNLRETAAATLRAMSVFRHPLGGWREAGDLPFQANCNMHMLEASLAWEDLGAQEWGAVADDVARLAMTRFIDAENAVLHEFFDERWERVEPERGLIEPGHQFEWGWLLDRWGRKRGDTAAVDLARRLYLNGLAGVDRARGVTVNALWADFTVRDPVARFWPQTEYLKAALIFGQDTEALTAAKAIAKYLATPAAGVWRDKMAPDGGFIEEPAPATSLYHVYGAIAPLLAAG